VTSACKQLNDKYGKRGLHFRFVYDRYDAENANLLEIEIVPVPVRPSRPASGGAAATGVTLVTQIHHNTTQHNTQHTIQELGV
jgi:hypothetical protein